MLFRGLLRRFRETLHVLRTEPRSDAVFWILFFGRGRKRRFFVAPPGRQLKKLFQRHPVLANALCYGFLCGSAELSQQTIKHRINNKTNHGIKNNEQRLKYDLGPVKRIALWGTVVIPPIYHKWYTWLDNKFPTSALNPTSRIMAKKIILDQFILTPPLLMLFFGVMAALEQRHRQAENHKDQHWGSALDGGMAEIRQKFLPTFAIDCAFWIPVQMFNFAYVPGTWRVLYIGAMSFVWLNVLCFIKSCSFEDNKK